MTSTKHSTGVARTRSRQRGFMLVSVIWITGLLSAFAVAVSVSVRSHALHARNAMSGGLAAGIADGITRLAALAVARPGSIVRVDGSWRSCRWMGEADAWVSVQDQGGLVDLNTAAPPLLRALFAGLGVARKPAAELAGALRDYRDGDHVADLGGTEPEHYPGRPFGPKNLPFAAVEELDQLPGMTPGLRKRLAAVTTVSNRQAGIDVATAPDALLQVLGLSRTSAAGLSFAAPHAAHVMAVTVAVRLNDGTRFVRRAMIERTDQPERPFAVSAWDDAEWPAATPPAGTGLPCLDTHGAFRPAS